MTLTIVTIVLDGMPCIAQHLAEFDRMKSDWEWIIIEGQSRASKDTSWCKPMPARLSNDGTTEYLDSIADHPRVTVVRSEIWDSKTDQINAGVRLAKKAGALMQVDSDEMWKAEQLDLIVQVFETNPDIAMMRFFCRYFLGKDIVAVEKDSYGNNSGEWLRAWRFRPTMLFNRHEPPILNLNRGRCLSREDTKKMGLVFDHYSWVEPKTIRYKEQFYGYKGAYDGWKRLQENKLWPCRLKQFLPWVDDAAIADKV